MSSLLGEKFMKAEPPSVSASLVENGEDEDHGDVLHRLFGDAAAFIGIVAFAKVSGWKLIQGVVKERVAKGLNATFVIGIDFYQSDPEVLRSLLRLRESAKRAGGEVKVYMGREAGRYTLHPKAYWFKSRKREVLVLGSANMTSGGFADNHELSVELSGAGPGWQTWLKGWISERISKADIVEATGPLIDRYESRRDIYRAAMKAAERRAKRSMAEPPGQIVSLADLLGEMRANDGPEGFAALVKQRRRNHSVARTLLAGLARQPRLNRHKFLAHYEELIGHWHSGGLQRGKTTIAKKAPKFQAAIKALTAERSDDPATLFNLLKTHFDKVPRAGTNVLTEILHNRDPKRFPVMNRNSVAGMGLANIAGYPRAPAKTTVDGECYARFTADAEALRQRLQLRDLAELDVLFNFAYWKTDEDSEED